MSPLHWISFLSFFVSLLDTKYDQYLISLFITLSTAALALLPLFLSVTPGQKSCDILQREFFKSSLIYLSSILEYFETRLFLNSPSPYNSVSWAVFLTAKHRQWITRVRTGSPKALNSVCVNCRCSLVKQTALPRWREQWVETFVWHRPGSSLCVGLIIWSVAEGSLFIRAAQYCDKRVACQSLCISR